jgi:hypothetical protein
MRLFLHVWQLFSALQTPRHGKRDGDYMFVGLGLAGADFASHK